MHNNSKSITPYVPDIIQKDGLYVTMERHRRVSQQSLQESMIEYTKHAQRIKQARSALLKSRDMRNIWTKPPKPTPLMNHRVTLRKVSQRRPDFLLREKTFPGAMTENRFGVGDVLLAPVNKQNGVSLLTRSLGETTWTKDLDGTHWSVVTADGIHKRIPVVRPPKEPNFRHTIRNKYNLSKKKDDDSLSPSPDLEEGVASFEEQSRKDDSTVLDSSFKRSLFISLPTVESEEMSEGSETGNTNNDQLLNDSRDFPQIQLKVDNTCIFVPEASDGNGELVKNDVVKPNEISEIENSVVDEQRKEVKVLEIELVHKEDSHRHLACPACIAEAQRKAMPNSHKNSLKRKRHRTNKRNSQRILNSGEMQLENISYHRAYKIYNRPDASKMEEILKSALKTLSTESRRREKDLLEETKESRRGEFKKYSERKNSKDSGSDKKERRLRSLCRHGLFLSDCPVCCAVEEVRRRLRTGIDSDRKEFKWKFDSTVVNKWKSENRRDSVPSILKNQARAPYFPPYLRGSDILLQKMPQRTEGPKQTVKDFIQNVTNVELEKQANEKKVRFAQKNVDEPMAGYKPNTSENNVLPPIING